MGLSETLKDSHLRLLGDFRLLRAFERQSLRGSLA